MVVFGFDTRLSFRGLWVRSWVRCLQIFLFTDRNLLHNYMALHPRRLWPKYSFVLQWGVAF